MLQLVSRDFQRFQIDLGWSTRHDVQHRINEGLSVEPGNRPFEGDKLRDILRKLALVNAKVFSLRENLTPLSREDLAFGAEPLSQQQIADAAEELLNLVASIALENLSAQPDEWLAANDSIE